MHTNTMRRFTRWLRSLPALVALNTTLVAVAVGVGSQVSMPQFEEAAASGVTRSPEFGEYSFRTHALHILRGNLRVVGVLLAGACTLGALTLFTLLWNAVVLGSGFTTLAGALPGAAGLLLRYVVLEFFAFILVASVAEHLSVMVLRCLAGDELPRLAADAATLAAALALLVIAALIEADVAIIVAASGM